MVCTSYTFAIQFGIIHVKGSRNSFTAANLEMIVYDPEFWKALCLLDPSFRCIWTVYMTGLDLILSLAFQDGFCQKKSALSFDTWYLECQITDSDFISAGWNLLQSWQNPWNHHIERDHEYSPFLETWYWESLLISDTRLLLLLLHLWWALICWST